MSESSPRQPESRYPVFEPLAETTERVIETILTRTGKPELETGIRVLDKGLFGLHKSQMTVIAARPGIGKTSFVCQLAMNLAKRKYKVAFLSLEMTKENILERIFCIENDVNGFDLLKGIISDHTKQKLSNFLKEVSPLSLRIIDDYCHRENELYTLIEHLKFRPEIIIFDHIQHIQTQGKMAKWEALTEYLRYLKQVAMQFQIAVVVLSQINREGDEKPSTTNLKGTGAIEEMADHVLLLHMLKEPNADSTNFQVNISKNRFGPTGTFDLYFDAPRFRFYDDCPYNQRKAVV